MSWVNMMVDIENSVRQCGTWLEYQQTQSQERFSPHESSEVVGADIFMIDSKFSVHCRLLQQVSCCEDGRNSCSR